MKHLAQFVFMNRHIPKFAQDLMTQMMWDLRNYDVDTFEHCRRVSEMAIKVAEELGLSPMEQATVGYAGFLHDLGKRRVPLEILNKPGKLDNDEFEIMKNHAQYGVDMMVPLTTVPFFKVVSEIVKYHHERVDGQGYFKLPSQKIPYNSKIILVVDTVDAMTQDRPYRKGLPFEVACEELIRCTGTQFEAAIVDAFFAAYRYRAKKSA